MGKEDREREEEGREKRKEKEKRKMRSRGCHKFYGFLEPMLNAFKECNILSAHWIHQRQQYSV